MYNRAMEAQAGAGNALPHTKAFDSTLRLARDGYAFISGTCAELGTDIFRTRILLRPVTCMSGPEAAGMFYDGDRFTRQGAMPPTTVALLQDYGSVQMLDGTAHVHRKAMFWNMLVDERQVKALTRLFDEEWDRAEERWLARRRVSLLPEVSRMLGRAVWRWAGLPEPRDGGDRHAATLDAMVANAGRFGPRNWLAQMRRNRLERKLRRLIRRIRKGRLRVAEDAPARIIALHRDEKGNLLSAGTAAVELLNLLRPVVAVSRFIVYSAIALEQHPEPRICFAAEDFAGLEGFVEEVRRYFPFFPFVGGKVREEFTWRGHTFQPGEWVLLDLRGTNLSRQCYADPEVFRPDRGISWKAQNNCFIPQGGGSAETGHRCPGERVTVALMMAAVKRLSRLYYAVPPDCLRLPPRRYPPEPRGGFIMKKVTRDRRGEAA